MTTSYLEAELCSDANQSLPGVALKKYQCPCPGWGHEVKFQYLAYLRWNKILNAASDGHWGKNSTLSIIIMKFWTLLVMGDEVKFQYLPLMKWKFDENFQVGYGYIRLLIVNGLSNWTDSIN